MPWDGAHNKISAAIAGQQTPDVTMLGTTWVGEFAKTGALDVTPPDFVNKDDFFPGAWETGVVDGTSYSVPWYVETRLLFVNKAVAEKAGITEAPKDWDALTQAVKDMQTKGGAKWGTYLQPGQTGAWQTRDAVRVAERRRHLGRHELHPRLPRGDRGLRVLQVLLRGRPVLEGPAGGRRAGAEADQGRARARSCPGRGTSAC